MKLFIKILIALSLSAFTFSAGTSTAQETFPPETLADPDGQFIEIDGESLYYIESGLVDGPTVMLLHGFGGSTFTWRENIPALVEAGYHVIAYDRPPFGLSEKSAELDLSATAQADQLARLMDALNIKSATLVGHSAGGQVIGKFATLYPARVESLIFVDGAVIPGDGQESDEQTDSTSPVGGLFSFGSSLDPESPLAQGLVRRFLTPERFINILSSAYYDPEMVTEEVAEGYSRILSVENWEAGFLALFSASTFEDRVNLETLAGFEKPVALMWGEDDTWVPIGRGEALRDIFTNTEPVWITFEDSGHLPMEENADEFNMQLVTFLEKVYLPA